MSKDNIKKSVLTNPILKASISIFVIGVLILYFKIFFTIGINYENTFLKKEVNLSESNYVGKSVYGVIHITVEGVKNKDCSADVIYKLPNSIIKRYTVDFKDNLNWDLGINDIKDKDGNVIFEGEYKKDSYYLLDKNGQPLMDGNIQVLINGETPYNSDYEIPLKNVADLASFSKDTIRGKVEFLVFAVILFGFTLIDIKFPLFFFTLRHFMDVRDPEPSEFYIIMQRILWYVLPAIGVILMIVAIN